jgi:hypothetical protein
MEMMTNILTFYSCNLGVPMLNCINLLETFGAEYRIEFDEAYDPRGKPRDRLDPWMMLIPCRYGEIYPEGGQYLRVDIDYHNQIAARVAALPGCTLYGDGDDEKTIRFHVDQFEAVAKLVKPYRRVKVSQDTIARLIRVGEATRFVPAATAESREDSTLKPLRTPQGDF